MTDTSETERQEAAKGDTPEQQPVEKTLTQSEVDRIVNERLAREKAKYADYEDLKTAAARLKKIEDANKSEQQQTQERIDELTKQLADRDQKVAQATLASLKAMVAADKNVPASSLTGSTQEELEASADELIAWRDAAAPKRKPPTSSGLKSGATGTSDMPTDPKERAAAALREMRSRGV